MELNEYNEMALNRINEFLMDCLQDGLSPKLIHERICESLASSCEYHMTQYRQNKELLDLMRTDTPSSISETEKLESVMEPFDVFDKAISQFNEAKRATAMMDDQFLDYVREYTDNVVQLDTNSK